MTCKNCECDLCKPKQKTAEETIADLERRLKILEDKHPDEVYIPTVFLETPMPIVPWVPWGTYIGTYSVDHKPHRIETTGATNESPSR